MDPSRMNDDPFQRSSPDYSAVINEVRAEIVTDGTCTRCRVMTMREASDGWVAGRSWSCSRRVHGPPE